MHRFIIRPVVGASALTWLSRYVFIEVYSFDYVIIIKINVPVTQVTLIHFGYAVFGF